VDTVRWYTWPFWGEKGRVALVRFAFEPEAPDSTKDPFARNAVEADQMAEGLVPYVVCCPAVAPDVVTAVPFKLVAEDPEKLLE
jgi:hypothetical protein